MVVVIEGTKTSTHPRLFETMFEDRKRLFVDLLKWDIPVVGNRFEQDGFDHDDAVYLIALDTDGFHAGSMRLLPTTKPHILSELFPALCDGELPRGQGIFEITRLCLPTRHGAAHRLRVRNLLISAMVDHSLTAGIGTFTGVVEASFRTKVLAMGWRCASLGEARRFNDALLGAFRIEIGDDTPERLCRNAIYTPRTIRMTPPERTAA